MDNNFQEIRELLIKFRDARDWKQFHDPKNLAEAISIESNELLQNFLWKTTDESKRINSKILANVKEELADVFIYLILLADALKIDLTNEARKKIKKNERRYPILKAKGKSKKYTEL